MKEKKKESKDNKLSIDESLAEMIDLKKNENSALKKIVDSLVKEDPQEDTNKK